MKPDHRSAFAAVVRLTSICSAAILPFMLAGIARAEAPHVAVANTAKIFGEMQQTKDLKAKLESKRTEISTEENDRRTKIKGMEDALHEIAPDNPQFKANQASLDKAMADFDSWGKLVRLQAERDQKDTMVMLFTKIQAAVGTVAKQDGIDIVIADQGPDLTNTETLTFDQLRGLINQKDVLYTSKKADISDEVLTLLDAQYAKDKAAGK